MSLPENRHNVGAVEQTDEATIYYETTDVDDDPVPHLHAKTWLIGFAVMVVYTAQVIQLVGTGAFNQAVAATVGGNKDGIWLVALCAIEAVVFGPPFSQIADYWGRRWALIIPTFCGIIGSIITARATSMPMAIGGNVIINICFGAQPLLHAVASEVLTHRNRVTAQAAVNIGSGIGGIIGLLAGAALTKNPAGFRNYWYMTAGVYALGIFLVFVCYTPALTEFQRSMSHRQKLAKLDWVGYILLTCGLVLFMVGLFMAENLYSWKDAHTLVTLVIGVVIMISFIIYECKFKTDGMVHHDLFSRDRNFAIALGCIFCEGAVVFSANGYLAYEVGVLYETITLRVVLHFAIAFIIYTVSCVAPAIYCYRTKRLRLPTIFAFGSFLTFCICMATATSGSGKAVWAYPVFLGLGLAVALCSLVSAAQLSAPPRLIGTTSGLMIAMRSFGGSIGLAIYTAIINSRLSTVLRENIARAALPLGLPKSSLPELITDISSGNSAALAKGPGTTAQIIEASVLAFEHSFSVSVRGVPITGAYFAFLALIASFFLINPINDFNMHIDAPAESAEALYGDEHGHHHGRAQDKN